MRGITTAIQRYAGGHMIKNIGFSFFFLLLSTLVFLNCGGNTDNPVQGAIPNALNAGNFSAVISADQPNYTGKCPHPFQLSAHITMDSEGGRFTYWWEDLNQNKTFDESTVWARDVEEVDLTGAYILRSTGSADIVLNIGPPHVFVSKPVRLTAICE